MLNSGLTAIFFYVLFFPVSHSSMLVYALEPVLKVRLQAVQPSLAPGLVWLDTANYCQMETLLKLIVRTGKSKYPTLSFSHNISTHWVVLVQFVNHGFYLLSRSDKMVLNFQQIKRNCNCNTQKLKSTTTKRKIIHF